MAKIVAFNDAVYLEKIDSLRDTMVTLEGQMNSFFLYQIALIISSKKNEIVKNECHTGGEYQLVVQNIFKKHGVDFKIELENIDEIVKAYNKNDFRFFYTSSDSGNTYLGYKIPMGKDSYLKYQTGSNSVIPALYEVIEYSELTVLRKKREKESSKEKKFA